MPSSSFTELELAKLSMMDNLHQITIIQRAGTCQALNKSGIVLIFVGVAVSGAAAVSVTVIVAIALEIVAVFE